MRDLVGFRPTVFGGRNSRQTAQPAIKKALNEYLRGTGISVTSNFSDRNYLDSNQLNTILRQSFQDFEKIRLNAQKIAQDRVEFLGRLFERAKEKMDFAPKNLLDIGSGDGAVTQRLSSIFGINSQNILGVEVLQDSTQNKLPFKTELYDGENVSQATNNTKFDLVSLIAVLHHSKKPATLLRQAHDSLTPSGYLIVQEHNNKNGNDKFFHSFMDDFEYRLLGGNSVFGITNKYKTRQKWIELSKSIGFKPVTIEEPKKENPFRRFVMLLQKK